MNPERIFPTAVIPENGHSLEWENERRLRELVDLTMDMYASNCLPILRSRVRAGDSKAEIKLGEAKSYKLGDVEVEIDPIGEIELHNIVDSLSLPAKIHGEHQEFSSPTGVTQVYFEIDPFDNTSEYQAGLDTPPWTVVSAYSEDGTPLSSFVGNIKDNKGYFLQGGRVFEKDFETGERRYVKKSERKSLFEEGSVLASYTGSSEYSGKFYDEFNEFTKQRPPKAIFHGGGGAYIYGPLAAGIVDAYVMFDEPYEEIDPGAAIALAAGCIVGYYNSEKDEWVDYKYDPNREEKTVGGLFIAAANTELRDELINYYRQKHQPMPAVMV